VGVDYGSSTLYIFLSGIYLSFCYCFSSSCCCVNRNWTVKKRCEWRLLFMFVYRWNRKLDTRLEIPSWPPTHKHIYRTSISGILLYFFGFMLPDFWQLDFFLSPFSCVIDLARRSEYGRETINLKSYKPRSTGHL